MSYVPRHGSARGRHVRGIPAGARRPLVGAGIAAALLASVGAAVSTSTEPATAAQAPLGRGVPTGDALTALTDSADVSGTAAAEAERLAQQRRDAAASRSASREQQRRDEAERKKAEKERRAEEAKKERADKLKAAQRDPRSVALAIMGEYGFDKGQWQCLNLLWTGESDWTWNATNPSSGAYGIPQSLPASKMASAGPDWKTNPETQIRWGLDYIRQSYGTPCGALDFWNSQNPHWY